MGRRSPLTVSVRITIFGRRATLVRNPRLVPFYGGVYVEGPGGLCCHNFTPQGIRRNYDKARSPDPTESYHTGHQIH